MKYDGDDACEKCAEEAPAEEVKEEAAEETKE
jgi:hypothetical protein